MHIPESNYSACQLTSRHSLSDERIFYRMATTLANHGFESSLIATYNKDSTPNNGRGKNVNLHIRGLDGRKSDALSRLIESIEEYYPVVCNTNTDEWAAEVVLSEGDRFCVDSTGFASESSSPLGSANVCFNNELSEQEKDQIREALR